MRLSALRSFVLVAALSAFGCATAPQRYEADFGATTDGRMAARPTSEGTVAGETASTGFRANSATDEGVKVHRAMAIVNHIRTDKVTGRKRILGTDTVWNVKTTAGIDFLFAQGYGSSGAQANGLVYIGCSNDALTETTASTDLSNEIAANGLSRAIGTYAHTAGQSTATISKTFTATGAQSVQKCALFSASSGGTMTHVLSFTQRALQTNDQLAITFTITLSYEIKSYRHFGSFAMLTIENLQWSVGPTIARDPFRVDEEQTYLMAA